MAVLLLAVVTELVQLWVSERAFNPFDLVANVGGLAAGRLRSFGETLNLP